MTEREKNIEYICSKTLLNKDDELVPIILKMLSETYIDGLKQGQLDIQLDANLNDREELTADEMFKKLRYKCLKNEEIIWFQRDLNKLTIKDIIFDLSKKLVSFEILFYDTNKNLRKKESYINIPELQAINKKVEELRMDIEKIKKNKEQWEKDGKEAINNNDIDKAIFCAMCVNRLEKDIKEIEEDI